MKRWWIAAAFLAVGCNSPSSRARHGEERAHGVPVPLPGGEGGIGFDDLRFSARLGKLLVPAGRTGDLDLVDPTTGAVDRIGGFSAQARFGGGHGQGPTSVDEGRGLLFAVDRTGRRLAVVDPVARAITASAALASSPDYVRWVEPTGELWVTEPDADRIEVFSLPPGDRAVPVHAGFIQVPGGPESLVIDPLRRRAYTHLWKGATVAIDLTTRRIVATWPNGCVDSRGIALDEARGWLFAACEEGTVVLLDAAHDGAELSRASTGAGVDIIDYQPARSRLYVPAGDSATLTILGVAAGGTLSIVTSQPAVAGGHCVTSDGRGAVFVCDPARGRLVKLIEP